MVQLLPCKHRPRMQKQPNQGTEPPCIVTSPMLCQHQPNNGEKPESRWIYRLVAELPQCSLLAVCKCCAASEECCEQGYRLVCMKLSCSMLWHLKCIEQLHCVSVPTFNSLCKNLAWWAVRTTYLSLKGGYVDRDGRLHGTIQYVTG